MESASITRNAVRRQFEPVPLHLRELKIPARD